LPLMDAAGIEGFACCPPLPAGDPWRTMCRLFNDWMTFV
jgi:hypothetical protein